jgi:hypothetical protein
MLAATWRNSTVIVGSRTMRNLSTGQPHTITDGTLVTRLFCLYHTCLNYQGDIILARTIEKIVPLNSNIICIV